jgi:uncharacterized repeat protein (TIGR03803 family)
MTSLKNSATPAKSKIGGLLNLLLIFAFTAPGRTQTIEIVHDLEQNGFSPQAAVIEGSDGFLYGTTLRGTVSKTAKDSSGFTLLTSLCCQPASALMEASDGFLYGTTSSGGTTNQGTVFKIVKDGSGFILLKSFQCGTTDGCCPRALTREIAI